MNTELMFSSAGDLWRTDRRFIAWLKTRFDFTLDAAANDDTIAPRFIGPEQDALKTPWDGRAYCNPPYSLVERFVLRAIGQRTTPHNEGVCLLVPARTDTAWWQDSWPEWNRIELLRGRLKFWLTPAELEIVNAVRASQGKKPLTSTDNPAPFPSALLIAGFGLQGHTVTCVDWKAEAKRLAA